MAGRTGRRACGTGKKQWTREPASACGFESSHVNLKFNGESLSHAPAAAWCRSRPPAESEALHGFLPGRRPGEPSAAAASKAGAESPGRLGGNGDSTVTVAGPGVRRTRSPGRRLRSLSGTRAGRPVAASESAYRLGGSAR